MADTETTADAIEKRVVDALIEFGAEEDLINPSATWDQLDVDSLDLVELAQIVEDEYGVELREADMKEMETVGDAVELISGRLA